MNYTKRLYAIGKADITPVITKMQTEGIEITLSNDLLLYLKAIVYKRKVLNECIDDWECILEDNIFNTNIQVKSTERETIVLTATQHEDLCSEGFLEIDGNEIPIEIISDKYSNSGRHQEYWDIVIKRLSDGKFFTISYSKSVKDSMGWDDCNYGVFNATEVFPESIVTVIYK